MDWAKGILVVVFILVYIFSYLLILATASTCPNNIGICNSDIPFQSALTGTGTSTSVNYSAQNVNNSWFWQNLIPSTFQSIWINGTFIPYNININLGAFGINSTGTQYFRSINSSNINSSAINTKSINTTEINSTYVNSKFGNFTNITATWIKTGKFTINDHINGSGNINTTGNISADIINGRTINGTKANLTTARINRTYIDRLTIGNYTFPDNSYGSGAGYNLLIGADNNLYWGLGSAYDSTAYHSYSSSTVYACSSGWTYGSLVSSTSTYQLCSSLTNIYYCNDASCSCAGSSSCPSMDVPTSCSSVEVSTSYSSGYGCSYPDSETNVVTSLST